MSYPLRRALASTVQEVLASEQVSQLLNEALAHHLEEEGLDQHNTDEDLVAIDKVEFVPAPRKLLVRFIRGGREHLIDLTKRV